jgi:hypothetical protein
VKIVQYIPDFGLGGVQKAGWVLGREMARLGHSTAVMAAAGGPRFSANPQPASLTHRVLQTDDPRATAAALLEHDPQVIHLHGPAYHEQLIEQLHAKAGDQLRSGRRVLVSTPVFGRPPLQKAVLSQTRTVCVGVYTFYRLCRWLGLTPSAAIGQGLAYAPMTPFEPPPLDVSANDPPDAVRRRRESLGVNPAAFVVGRIGRNDPGKWNAGTESLIRAALQRHPTAVWLSIGLPVERGADALRREFGPRFVNLDETPDYRVLTEALSCMDVQIFFSMNGECFASSISEAAGVGVPTIALATPLKDNGQAEQVIDGATGVLVASASGAVDAIGRHLADHSFLASLKRNSQAHATQRWHAARVADDLLSLYHYWVAQACAKDAPPAPPYEATMLFEASAFAAGYHERMLRTMARGFTGRLKWRLLLAAVESWSVFRIGRFLKRLRHPLPAPQPPDKSPPP